MTVGRAGGKGVTKVDEQVGYATSLRYTLFRARLIVFARAC